MAKKRKITREEIIKVFLSGSSEAYHKLCLDILFEDIGDITHKNDNDEFHELNELCTNFHTDGR